MLPLFAVHLYRALNSPDRIDTDIDTPPKHRRNTPTVSSTASITEKMLECLVPSKTAVLDPPLVAVTPIVVQVDGDDPVKLDLDTHPPATSLIAASPPESRASLFLSVITSRNTTMTDREHSCTELIALAGSRTPRTAQFLLLNGVMDSLIDHVLCFVASSMEKQFVKNRIEELQKQQSKFMECSKLEKELRQVSELCERAFARACSRRPRSHTFAWRSWPRSRLALRLSRFVRRAF